MEPDAGAIQSIYHNPQERFVVSLVVSYSPDDGVLCPEEAVAAAVDLVTNCDCTDTEWYVYDRETGEGQFIRQGDAHDLAFLRE